MRLWLMVWRGRVYSREGSRSDPRGYDFFRDWFGDRDGSCRVRACEGMRAEMACVRGLRRTRAHGGIVHV